jgi:hypothetical protein
MLSTAEIATDCFLMRFVVTLPLVTASFALGLYVASELHEQVEWAAAEAGVNTAPWLRHMVRQVTLQDFPTGWQAATPRERSRDSQVVYAAAWIV